jgi:hypothetical protein
VSHKVKSLALHIKAAVAVDDATLAKINALTLRPFTADELQVREYVLAHNCIDRDNEVFDEALLEDFKNTLPGKGVHIVHPTSYRGTGGPAEGKVFDTATSTMSLDDARTMLGEPKLQLPPDRTMVTVLTAKAYFARTPDNASLLIKQDAGIAGDVSVGFNATDRVAIKDAQGNELTARRWMGPGSADEMSLVWLGAQQGARAIKSATEPTDPDPTPESSMKPEEIAALQSKAAEGEKSTTTLAAVKTALGDDAVLLDNPAMLKAYIVDAKAFKESLVNDIVGMERQLKMVGDTDDDVKNAKAFLADFPVERLQLMQKNYEARLPGAGQGQMKGANTNTKAAGTDAPAADSPLNNPALAG